MQGGYQLFDFKTIVPIIRYNDGDTIIFDIIIDDTDSRYNLLQTIINGDKPLIIHNIKFTNDITFDEINNILLTKTTQTTHSNHSVTQSAILKNFDYPSGLAIMLINNKTVDSNTIQITMFKTWEDI